METTAQEVVELFAVTPHAQREYSRWTGNPVRKGEWPSSAVRPPVPRIVMEHRTRFLYEIRPQDVEEFNNPGVCEHALSDIKKGEGEGIALIKDGGPAVTFMQTLHYAMESAHELLTYQGFRDFCRTDRRAFAMLGAPSYAIAEKAVNNGFSKEQAKRAVRWRVGNAYLSFLRETYTIASLRTLGVDVRYHPLADGLFRTDAWTGRTVLALHIKNKEYRDGAEGRKRFAESLLDGGGFSFMPIALGTQHTFGDIHLPSPERIRTVALELQKHG